MTDDPAVDAQRPASKPPFPIILIAVFQFVKAGFLLYLFFQFSKNYSPWAASGRPDSPFLRSFQAQPFIVFFPVLSVVLIAIGWGLMRLRPWARGVLLGTTICTWLGGKFGSHLSLNALFFANDIDLRHSHFPTIFCVFLLDLFVFCSLVFYPGIAETFGEKEG